MSETTLPQLLAWVRQHRSELCDIAVLTGAGISAESGIPTFRGQDNLWRGVDPSELFTPDALHGNPERTWQMYDELRTRVARTEPNPGHYALAKLEELCRVTLATQNIDGLHQRAGSAAILELHGSLWRLRCDACNYCEENAQAPLPQVPPRCPQCTAILRPDIVLYTESLPTDVFARAVHAAETCDLMLVIGTSGVVYPAAGLPQVAHMHGAIVMEINPQETSLTREMDFALHETASRALPEIVAALAEP